MNVIIKRGITDSVVIPIDEKAIYRKRLMAEWYIEIPTISHTKLDIQIGDYIVFDSENYYVNRLPKLEKINNNTFSYTIIFDSVVSELNNKLFISSDGLSEYSYTGTPTDFVTNIVASVNTISSGWTVGTCEVLDARRMDFVNETCISALVRVAEEFGLEFNVVSKEISLVKTVGTETALVFQYGRSKGLYNIIRQQIQDANILTRVYGFGGTRNIPYDYRSRAKRLVFAERYLEKNTDLYGVIEGQFTDDTIYPQRTGQLTASSIIFVGGEYSTQYSYVADSSLDFDLNNYLLEGQVAKIVFKTGDLAGLEFEISRYEHLADGLLPARRIYFNPYVDQDDSYSYPNFNGGYPIKCEIGDSYTLVDIKMPQSYVDTAEALLKSKTQEFIDENSVPRVVYEVNIDPRYARDISFSVGDKVTIVDVDLGINSLIRISGIDFPLTNTNKITALIADFVPYTLQERIIKNIVEEKKEIKIVDKSKVELARRNTMRQNLLKEQIFDTDGYFDNTNIRPLSIETMYLAVGTKSSNFFLSGVTIKANYGADANSIFLGAGSLIHLQIAIVGLGYTWVLSQSIVSSLNPALSYYVYAKCSKSALTGEYIVSTSQITVEQVTGYYHFLLGSLFVVADGYRDFDFTYGMTYIVGNTITTGRIKSIDGLNYFDLTDSKFRIGDSNSSLDWNVTADDTLTLKGALVQSPSGDTNPLITFRGTYSSGTTYYKGDQVTYGGSSWNYINATPASGQTPAEGAYWTVAASVGSAGSQGSSIVFRGDFSASTIYFNNIYERDAVKYSGAYYLYKGTNGVAGAWSAGNWESFGSSWTSVATGLLLAEEIYTNFIIAQKIATSKTGARVTINYEDDEQKIAIYNSSGEVKVAIKPSDITTKAVIEAGADSESFTPTAVSTASVEIVWNWTNGFGSQYNYQYSTSFEATIDGILEIAVSNITTYAAALQKTSADGAAIVSIYLQKYINSVWTRVGLIGTSTTPTNTIRGLSAGIYRLEAEHFHQGYPSGDYDEDATVTTQSNWNYTSGSSFIISVVSVLAQTELGTNGFASIWSSSSYFHYTADGWFVRGLPTSSSGLATGQIWVDGTTLKIV